MQTIWRSSLFLHGWLVVLCRCGCNCQQGCLALYYFSNLIMKLQNNSFTPGILFYVEQVKQEVGHVSILFNNAGLIRYSPFLEADPVMDEKILKVNLLSYMWITREFLPEMIQRGKGHLVQTGSGLGFYRWKHLTSYVASKYGLRGFIDSLRVEMQLHPKKPDIKFTTIYPAWIKTPMMTGVSWKSR